MNRTGLSLISLFVINVILACPAFSQKIAGYVNLGSPCCRYSVIASIANPRTNKIYVADPGSPEKIIVVNAATRTISSTITVTGTSDIQVDSNHNKVYAFDGTNIYEID